MHKPFADRGDCLDHDRSMSQPGSRAAPEAARRIIALACVGAASNDLDLRQEILSWLAAEGIDSSLSPKERQFLVHPDPSEQDTINFSWSSEAIAVIGWALGLQDQLLPPLEQSSVGGILDQLPAPGEPVSPFINGATLRSGDDLNDCAAKLFDIHAWCRSAADKNQPERHGYDLEVAQAQHRAINWLVRHEGIGWDDVATDT